MTVSLLWVVAWLFAQPAPGGGGPAPAIEGVERMKSVAFLVGEWAGEGWVSMGPQQRHTLRVTESVRVKAGGRVLLVEGLGNGKRSESEPETTLHE
ncbi:MAG: hypothetical protein AAB363_10515, partial [Planctomycetota bacterium]